MSTEMRDVKLVSVVEDDKGLQSPDSNGDTPTTVSDIPANEKPAKSMDKGDDIRVEIQDDVTIKSDVEAAAAPPPLEYDIPAGWWIVFAGFATLFLAGGIHYSWLVCLHGAD